MLLDKKEELLELLNKCKLAGMTIDRSIEFLQSGSEMEPEQFQDEKFNDSFKDWESEDSIFNTRDI